MMKSNCLFFAIRYKISHKNAKIKIIASDSIKNSNIIPHFVVVNDNILVDFKKIGDNKNFIYYKGKPRFTRIQDNNIAYYDNYFEFLKNRFYWFRYNHDWMLTKSELEQKRENDRLLDEEFNSL